MVLAVVGVLDDCRGAGPSPGADEGHGGSEDATRGAKSECGRGRDSTETIGGGSVHGGSSFARAIPTLSPYCAGGNKEGSRTS